MSDPNDPNAKQPPQPPRGQQLNIKIDEHIAQGAYSNLVLVSHGESEFVLDFMFLQPGRAEAKVNARAILSPLQAKRLMAALSENISRFEKRFGVIPMTGQAPPSDGTVH